MGTLNFFFSVKEGVKSVIVASKILKSAKGQIVVVLAHS